MQIFTDTFVYAVKTNLETLGPKQYMTASDLTSRLGLDETMKPAVMACVASQLPDFVATKAKGYGRRKEAPSATDNVAAE